MFMKKIKTDPLTPKRPPQEKNPKEIRKMRQYKTKRQPYQKPDKSYFKIYFFFVFIVLLLTFDQNLVYLKV